MPMINVTKKIKDLTKDDVFAICNINDWCCDCPLRFSTKCVEYEPLNEDDEVLVPKRSNCDSE